MTGGLARGLAALCAMLAFVIAHPAVAQTAPAPEEFPNPDGRGVDVITGSYNFQLTEGSIGPANGGVALVRYWGRSGWRDNWSGDLRRTMEGGVNTITITFGGVAQRFTSSGSGWTPVNGNGATLTETTADRVWVYRAADGTSIHYTSPVQLAEQASGNGVTPTIDMPTNYCTASNALACGVATRIVEGNGQSVSLTWNTPEQCVVDGELNTSCTATYRLTDVRTSNGYALKLLYASNQGATGSPGNQGPPPPGWFQRTGARFYDLSQVYCDATAFNCNSVTAAASVSYAYPAGALEITNSVAGVWRVTLSNGRVSAIRRPGAASDTTTVAYDATTGRVTQVVDDGTTRTYATTTGATNTTTATDVGAGGGATTWQYGPAQPRPAAETNPTNATTTYLYDANNRLIRETAPLGNYIAYTRDARGNVTETRAVAIAGSGLADIVTTANYDATCANPLTCNQPNFTIDARGNRTDYTYGSAHGQVTRIQLPAPAPGQPRPEVNYTYTPLFAYVRDASGNLVATQDVQYRPTLITSCTTAATCAGTADELRITIAYDSPNLQTSSVTTANGTGTIVATTTYAYDDRDNLISIDGPLPGTGDTTTFIYDSLNRRRGVIGPDPDDAGPRVRVAERYSFDAESRVIKVERGTVTAATDAALTAMTAQQTLDILFDVNGRVVRQTASGGGTTFAVSQMSYDAQGRPTCTALRMNPATWAALPTDACTAATAGTEGPDRITRTSYDAADRPILVENGVGLATPAMVEVAASYTANGRAAHVQDGEGNRTTYHYDGHDRLSQTRYPVTTVGAQASDPANYEQLTYDPGGNVITRRLRDGQVIGYSYDALGRLITRDLPGTEPDVTYVYDLAGRLTSAVQGSSSLSFTYDALSRQLTQTGQHGTLTSVWDVAGRRTRLTYADGFFVIHDHDVLGNVTAIRENGATSGVGVLATYAYDALGRRSSVTFGNGSVRSYSYDAASQLSSLTNNLPGTANDLTLGFTYNPAGQIATNTRSNDAYAWTQHYNIDRLTSVDGLNRIVQNGTATFAHDGRGNLTSTGTASFAYSIDNMLSVCNPTAAGSACTALTTLKYDAAGRLLRVSSGGSSTLFQYDGLSLIAEYNASATLQRRYVHGPGTDEPIVWYEGSTISNATRRFLMADERGSITSVNDSTGTLLGINRYDEYGIPASTNMGRFGYTGQTWLPEINMWHYRARIYAPALGRFLQTDPIGYGDGLNLYAYVGGDPVNGRDPTGMFGLGGDPKPPPEPEPPAPRIVCEQIPGSRTVECLPVKDENDDGIVDYNDAVHARRYLWSEFSGGPVASQQQRFVAEVNRILRSSLVAPQVREANRLATQTGLEHGFWIYRNRGGYFPGGIDSGTASQIFMRNPCPLGCLGSTLVGLYHVHINGSHLLSPDDQRLAIRREIWIVAASYTSVDPILGTAYQGLLGYFDGRRR